MSTNLNDSFGPGGTYFKHYNMKIYNRWGTLIYSTDQGKPWDGKFNGDYAPEGVYIYDITIYGYEDTEIRKSGSFNVLR
jgi:gliding motility-associated-like protein